MVNFGGICTLCQFDDSIGNVIYSNQLLRIVWVDDIDYPGFTQVILNQHIKEMSDLLYEDALQVFVTLLNVEKIVKNIYCPDKINLASLGNLVPHLHWHIIPRYFNDKHFPNSIWGSIVNPAYIAPNHLCNLKNELYKSIQGYFIS